MKFLGVPSSGSMAGTVWSHNRAGQYQRNRRAPVQPIGTGRRSFMRSAFAAASSGWSALTGAQQSAWNAYGNLYPITDALGQSITLTGQQQFVSCGTQLLNCGQALPTLPPATNAVYSPVVSAFVPNQTTTPSFLRTLIAGPAGSFLLAAFGQQVSAGVGFWKTFWQMLSQPASTTAVTALAPYQAHFGALVTGRRVFAKFTPVNAGGVTGIPVIVNAIVT
jgi:hypothetical protein